MRQSEVAGSESRWKRRCITAEIGPVRASANTTIAELAIAPPIVRLSQVSNSTDYHGPVIETRLDALTHMGFHAGHFHRRQELSVWKLREPLIGAAYAGETFNIIVPRSDILVPDGPVHPKAVLGIRLEIQFAEAIGLTTPKQGASTHMVATHPIEWLVFRIWIIHIIHEPMSRSGMCRITCAVLLFLP